ncbi:apelin receptor 2 [Lampris incognitus]|uniref:apelin receptor 2 n=1 Tax=Lampris incognitus TaxID=2546036 RepID=UPI0024B624B6|nr:apelin receptor 2 [Lampris incognitus]
MSAVDFHTSPSPSPPALAQCDYSDWSPSFAIISSIYLLTFLVGCLGNSLVLWAYMDRTVGRKTRMVNGSRTKSQTRFGSVCCGKMHSKMFRNGQQNVDSASPLRRTFLKGDSETCQDTTKQTVKSSSQSTPSSFSPAVLPRSSRSLTDTLIASLAFADLCFLMTLPLWAVYTAMGYHWPFGQPLCQISSFLTALNMYASVFSLSMLSVERYLVLTGRRHPGNRTYQTHSRKAFWLVGGIWVLAGILALPGLLLRSVREVVKEAGPKDTWQVEPTQPDNPRAVLLSCQMDYTILIGAELEETERERAELWWAAALSLKSTLIGFLFPLLILLVCYCSLACLLSRHFGHGPHSDRRRQQRLLKVIVSLVMAFFLCWLPLHMNKTMSMLLEFDLLPYSCTLDQILLAAHPYVTCLAYLNSCLNPLLYAFCDSSFRRRCRGALLLQCSRWRREAEAESTRTQETADRMKEGTEERTERVGGVVD